MTGPGARDDRPHFSDRLLDAIERADAPACVGLDPVLDRLPAAVRAAHQDPPEALRVWGLAVIDAVARHVPAVKPQSACFERFGARGVHALADVCAHARRRGLIVVLDAKRGDIGLTADHYAAGAAGMGADAITVNAYLGPQTVRPYLEAGLGIFVLVRTSNPDSDAVQSCALADGRTVAEMMADHVAALGAATRGRRGLSDVGAVVGATKAADAAALRARMPNAFFLVPGYGAQGGTAEDVRAMLRPDGTGVLVNASRSVLYAHEPGDPRWTDAVARAAESFAADVRRIRP